MKDFYLNWRFLIRRYRDIVPHSIVRYWFYHLFFLFLLLASQLLLVYTPARVVALLEEAAPLFRLLLPVAALGFTMLLRQWVDPLRYFSGMEYRMIDLSSSSCFLMGVSSERMNGPFGAEVNGTMTHVLYRGNNYGTEGMMRQSWDALADLLLLLGYFLFSIRLPWYWLLLLVAPSLIRGIVTHYYHAFVKKMEEEELHLYFEDHYLQQKLWSQASAKDLRLFHMKGLFADKMKDLRQKKIRLQKSDQLWLRGRDALGLSLNLLRDLAGTWILLRAYQGGSLPFSAVVLYLGILFTTSSLTDRLITDLGHAFRNSQQVTPYRKIFSLPQYDEGNFSEHLPEGPLELCFEDVSFSYGDAPLFEGLSLRIRAGEHLALVGYNGAGKTTLVKLASGLLTPSKGRILVNGVDLKNVNPRERYARVAMVFQDLEVFAASFEENIALKPKDLVDRERLEWAIDEAGLRQDLEKLPHGLATEMTTYLDPQGVNLSGGQTQRLMLARALYKSGDLLILDEPTSALDPLAEAAMYQEYRKFTDQKTAIFISHRLSSTQFCDRVLFLEKGKLVQDGSHDELMAVEGPYRDMFETQARYYREKPLETDGFEPASEQKEE